MKKLAFFVLLFGAAQVLHAAGYAYHYTATWAAAQAGGSDSASFPLLVTPLLAGNADFATTANGGYIKNTTTLNGQTVPADLIVTSDTACATKVTAWEVASYSATTGAMELWVNNGTLSHTVNTVLYICIGNSAVTTYQSTATSTWDGNYVGVWHHANGSTLSGNDSTSNGNSGTVNSASAATGQIDGGGSYNGSSASIGPMSGSSLDITGSITCSAWINSAAFATGSYQDIVGKGYDGTNEQYIFRVDTSNKSIGWFTYTGGLLHGFNNTATFTWAVNTWHLIVGTFNGSTWYLNFDGGATTFSNSDSTAPVHTAQATYIGAETVTGTPGRFFKGLLDEVRISSTNRSAAWITAEYNMEKPSQTMVTLGSKVALGAKPTNQIVEWTAPRRDYTRQERGRK
jgi:hypothetical protein